MSDITATKSAETLTLEFDEGLYPKDAIYGAAYIFIDRCYVHLDRPSPGRISVRLKLKEGVKRALDDLAGEFENEILGQAWRRQIIDENRELIEQVTTQALAGAAGPPGLDDLMSMDIDDDTAFEDPLGIAMSWEEKYKKKGKPSGGSEEEEPEEPSSSGEPPAGEGKSSAAGSAR
jgi:His-Xaa-Ser system protein HxsD